MCILSLCRSSVFELYNLSYEEDGGGGWEEEDEEEHVNE